MNDPDPSLIALNERLERRVAERTVELHASEGRLAGIIQSAMDAIITVDEEQNILLFNATAEKMFRCPAAEVLGQPITRFIPMRFRAAHRGHVHKFGETGLTNRAMGIKDPVWAMRADGEEFQAEASISRVEAGDKKLFTVILRDVTERKRAEQQLAEKVQELARSNADLEQFAYVASHDLQEPLRMVAAYTQLLSERYRGKLDETADKFIGYASDGALRMQALIRDLLTFSRVGRNSAPSTHVDCDAALKEVLLTLGPAIQESGAVIKHEGLPKVWADRSQITQLLQNLIGNAIKFRGKDPPAISVQAERIGERCLFSVSDNGIGIAPEHAENIFVVFQRLHTRTEYPGNGIGLAICKKIVDHHGGKIWVESQAGCGSVFKFTLPCEAPVAKELYQQAHA